MPGRISSKTIVLILLAILFLEGLWMLWNIRAASYFHNSRNETGITGKNPRTRKEFQYHDRSGRDDSFPFPDEDNKDQKPPVFPAESPSKPPSDNPGEPVSGCYNKSQDF